VTSTFGSPRSGCFNLLLHGTAINLVQNLNRFCYILLDPFQHSNELLLKAFRCMRDVLRSLQYLAFNLFLRGDQIGKLVEIGLQLYVLRGSTNHELEAGGAVGDDCDIGRVHLAASGVGRIDLLRIDLYTTTNFIQAVLQTTQVPAVGLLELGASIGEALLVLVLVSVVTSIGTRGWVIHVVTHLLLQICWSSERHSGKLVQADVW
jgi:hypothetical protein